MSEVPKFLTIRQTAQTKILPEACIRRMVKQGRIPGIYSGRTFLVNFDRLVDQLNSLGSEGARE
jgi:hypothetical protein